MASLGTLTLDLVAKTSGFVRGMSKAERASKKWKTQVRRDISAVSKAMGRGLVVGVAAAAAGLGIMIQRSRTAIDEQAKMAQRLGSTSEALAVLKRATDRTGLSMRVVETAARTLDINMGRATQGMAAQADAVAKLGIEVKSFSALSLDQKILTVNKALNENVPAWERMAVAADLFGSRGAAAIQQLSPETLRMAAEEAKVFGLALSEIDAAKVENANDSFSRLSAGFTGLSQQLTVEIAPLLELIGDEFFEMAKEAGSANQLVADSLTSVVDGIAFVADAADGVGRVFVTAADLAIQALTGLAAGAAENFADLLSVLSVIPGVDFSEAEASTRQFAHDQIGIFNEAGKNIRENLETPLAGQALRDGFQEARDAALAAATAAVALRDRSGEYVGELDQTVAKLSEIKVLSKDFVVSDELKDAIKVQEDYRKLLSDLRTDEEKLADQMAERLAIMDKMAGLTDEQRNSTASRIGAAALTESPDFGGLAPEVGGAGGELLKIATAQTELDNWYATQLEMLEKFRAERADLSAAWDEQELALQQEHADKLVAIDQARSQAQLAVTEAVFGDLASLTAAFAGKQSAAYKALFAIEKAAAIARSLVAIQAAIAQASASGPFPANLAAIASVISATAGIVSTITSTQIQGQAHDGLMSVPKTGTYLLEKGERVSTSKTSAKMDNMIDQAQSGGLGGGGVRVVNAFDSDAIVGDYLGSASGEQVIMNVVRRNARTVRGL